MKTFNVTKFEWLLVAVAIGLIVFAVTAKAQTTTQAGAASNAQVSNTSVSVSNGAPGAPGIANLSLGVNPSVSINSRGSDLGESVPLVTAPQMTVLGGEDSCLKSRSGGGAISGFGASFGTMVMDHECDRRVTSRMLYGLGLSEMATSVMCGSPKFWAAAERLSKRKGGNSICHNEQPSSAGVVSAKLRSRVASAGPTETDEDLWRFKPSEDEDFIY